jgi:hypothetical protein
MRRDYLALLIGTAIFIAFGAFILGAFVLYAKPAAPVSRPVGEEEEGPDREARIRAYFELIHRAAPGTDWRAIEAANAVANEQYRQGQAAKKTAGSFANGIINAAWHERGNSNTAGRMSAFAYNATGNTLYGLSDAGTLWKTTPPSGTWTLLNDDYQLASKVLAITSISGGGTRILMAQDTSIVYSDNNGATLQKATGISFPVAWGGNKINKIIVVNDAAHSVYALVQGWNSSPWAARVWLYRSTDNGQSFSQIYNFSNNSTDQVSLFSPYSTNQLYALAMNASGADSLFTISGNSVTLANTTTAFPTAATQSVLTGLMNGTQLQLYALIADSLIFQSGNTGASWTYVSTTGKTSWHLLSSSAKVAGNLFYGNVEAYRSTTGGASFNKVNNWGDYYGNEASKLHADIQAINFFQDANGSEFCIIGTDGGAYYSSDYLATVSNMSLSGLKVNQLWHHLTDPNNPSVLFSGMQDQGLCHSVAAGGTGIITQKQIISGDYGQMCISGQGGILWAEYPGGNMYVYAGTTNPLYQTTYNLQGSQKSNAAWMMPTCTIPGLTDEILLGGGNTSGGGGSYLVKLTYASGNVTAYQYPFDFRAASGNGTSGLSSIAISGLNKNLWYAATEDGTFFWSGNSGASWNKTASFSGTTGFWLYGAAIAPGKKNSGTVYFGGSGYSNAGVFVSRDSGKTFTAMNNGLPKTLINSLAVSPGDSLIFAATDAGPYVYVTAQQQWYPLIDANTPGCIWRTVEYIPSIGTARFSTYGRGVWDFVISGVMLPGGVAPASQPEVRMYPNPVAAGASVAIAGIHSGPAQLSFFDLASHCVAQQTLHGPGDAHIPVLPVGTYVWFIRQDEQTFRGRLVIR